MFLKIKNKTNNPPQIYVLGVLKTQTTLTILITTSFPTKGPWGTFDRTYNFRAHILRNMDLTNLIRHFE